IISYFLLFEDLVFSLILLVKGEWMSALAALAMGLVFIFGFKIYATKKIKTFKQKLIFHKISFFFINVKVDFRNSLPFRRRSAKPPRRKRLWVPASQFFGRVPQISSIR
ncbi:hypothetical protein KEH51_25605, partial [[Brevibacterium] frigoritolerans]|nr:hypothetical protein [Peribacillus frigoritolerans]